MKIKTDDGKMVIANEFQPKCISEKNDIKHMMLFPTSCKIMRACSRVSNRIYEYDCENGTCKKVCFVPEKDKRINNEIHTKTSL